MKNYKIAVLPGDGVGPEIMAEGIKVIQAALGNKSSSCVLTEYPIGAALYKKTGVACPPETITACRTSDAVYFGCAGLPDVRKEDGVELQTGYYYRVDLDIYANIRPVKLYPGVESPLRNKSPARSTISFSGRTSRGSTTGEKDRFK